MKLIISIENLKEFRPISETIPDERILPYIQEAHQLDLKRLLGDALYVDFLARFDQTGDSKYAAYQDLLKGKTYTSGGVSVEHPGLIGYMCYSALVRFYTNNPINVTKFGIVAKKDEKSEPVDSRVMASAIDELRSNAAALQVDIQNYLSSNLSLYPLYSYSTSQPPSMGVRFFDPDNVGRLSDRTLESR